MVRDERSAVSLKLLESKLCGVGRTKAWNGLKDSGRTKAGAYHRWIGQEGQGWSGIDWQEDSDKGDKREKEAVKKGGEVPISEHRRESRV